MIAYLVLVKLKFPGAGCRARGDRAESEIVRPGSLRAPRDSARAAPAAHRPHLQAERRNAPRAGCGVFARRAARLDIEKNNSPV